MRIDLLAEVDVDGATLHLLDIAVFPAGVGRAVAGCARSCERPEPN
ncbi:MAG: hypothetical protein ACRD1K_12755 [Acidimicrobiales bacterium]